MADSKQAIQFRDQVLTDLASLKGSNQNIIEHLLRLNGTVAKHEAALANVQIHGCEYSRERQKNKDRMERFLWGAIGGIALLALQHLDVLIKPFVR